MQKRQKYLDSLPIKIRLHILDILQKIYAGQWDALDVSPLHGQSSIYRCRYGKLRIIFSVENKKIEIISIGPRGDAYK